MTPPSTLPDLSAAVSRTREAVESRRRFIPVTMAGLVLVLLFAAGSARYTGFLEPQVALNLLVNNSFLIVLAVGVTFVILSGGIDLSTGAVLALSTMICAWLLREGWPPLLVIPVALLAGTAIGLAQGCMIHFYGVQPFIATLGGMFFARGLCYLISTESIPITDPLFGALSQTRIPLPGGTSLSLGAAVALAIAGVAAYVLHRTRFGRSVYAVGGSESSAMLMGLAVGRVKVGVYTVSGFCAALGGVLYTLYIASGNSLHGLGMELDAIAAVVIGGTLLTGGFGYVLGSVVGVLTLGTIQTILVFEGTLSSWWTKIVAGALLLVFILLQRVLAPRSAR
ncbi:galactofuranose ABC transporter, permease protein YjfF [Streptomonospora salina]|uniref:Simple sugar transport system permease protein n=1 Tax=Streptomonospora salina TaxID=104205 RepID=A0A841E0I3_9ACTN|nr:galactofuranose ABC transporter, permease protein YjfF [Streptomonospora salina]MBB5997257.1 simple sugar transport system permease protein [Streptomonospora salina]